MAKDKTKIFVSHSHANRNLAHTLIEELRRHDIAVNAAEDVPHDKDWGCVDRAIKAADAVIVLVGPKDGPGEFQLREWQAALEQAWTNPEKRLMAVLVDNAKTPNFLADRVAFRLNTRMEGPDLSKLVRALSNLRGVPQSVPIDREHSRQRKERLTYIGKAAESLKAD